MKEQPSILSFLQLNDRSKKYILAFLLLFPVLLSAQNVIPTTDTLSGGAGDTLRFSHPWLAPQSLQLTANGKAIPASAYTFDPMEGWLLIQDPTYFDQPIQAHYRYFPKFLNTTYAFRTFKVTTDSAGNETGFEVVENAGSSRFTEDFFESSQIKKSGSLSRGITVGNNQNLSVTSGLRLQLEGDLGDDLKLIAAITDENIPIQPDGTTQQIQDFDKVFVKVMKDKNSVILGDFEINHQGTAFANFYRNVQGIGVHVEGEKGPKASVNGAVAKGKFHTNTFIGQDGVNGPYRMTGRNNERFIIVLAGSEKVYLNGVLQTRGEGNDYTIDYNSGELTFTAQVVITSASRIVIDFEYTDRFYNRSLFFMEAEDKLVKDKLSWKFSYGRDADNQNAPIEGPYPEEALLILRDAGDNDSLAVISGVQEVGPATVTTAVQYLRNDTVVGGLPFERYIYSSDTNVAIYRISFSYVGPNNGMYIKSATSVNGTVFEWVGPDSSFIPKGDYEPVRSLALPHLLQVVDLRTDYQLSKKVKLYAELAASTEDKNRFSALNDGDNFGMATRTGVQIEKLRIGDSLTLRVDVSHQFVQERYQNLDRIYKVEYGRDWNYNDLGERLTENKTEGMAELNWRQKLIIRGLGGVRTFGDRLFSIKEGLEMDSKLRGISGTYKFITISTDDRLLETFSRWNRHNGDLYKPIGKKGDIRLGSEIWMEDKTLVRNDSTQNGAFRFYDFKPYFKVLQGEKFQTTLYYNYRREYEFLQGNDRDKSLAHTEYAKVIFNPWSNLNFQNTTSYRDFRVLDTTFTKLQGLDSKKSLMTNLQGTWFTNNRLVFTNLIYEVTQEQVAKKEVAYIEVNQGQGQYEWIDINENQVQELDEFQISTNPLRANFVRILIPTRELFPTTALNFSGNFKLDFKKVFDRSKNVFKETLRNFISITNFRVSQNKRAGTEFNNYIVNLGDIFGDTSLIDAQYTLREDIYFFRNNKVGDLQFSYADNKTKLFLFTGDEIRGLKTYGSNQRLNLDKSKSIENEVVFGRKFTKADAFATRNFDIRYWELKPKVNFQVNRKARMTFGYEYKAKTNYTDSLVVDATVNMHKLTADMKFNFKDRNNLFTRLELISIKQVGNTTFSAEYELRESLKPGFNAIWQAFLTFYISQSLELSLNYDGRASQDSKMLHSGRVQIKAFF